jgi:hypothetical protein
MTPQPLDAVVEQHVLQLQLDLSDRRIECIKCLLWREVGRREGRSAAILFQAGI